jgi:flagellar biosynthetic protein FliR
MTLHLSIAALIAFFLALVRGSAFLNFCPPFSNGAIPFMAKVGIAGGLAVAAVPTLSKDALPLSTGGLVVALVIQVVIGALIGLVIQLFFGAVQGAGALVDQFSGLNLPPAIDPLSLDQTPLLAQLYEWIATVLIFVSGADLLLAQGFIRSFSVVGTTIPERDIQDLPTFLSADLVAFFAAAAEIAAPLVAVVLAAQLLLGLLAKSAPQANVYALGFPLQLLLVIGGLGLAAVALPADVANLVGRGLSQLFGVA